MSRYLRVALPPSSGNASLDAWNRSIADALNQLPTFSIFSTSDGPNSSGITANVPTIGFEIGSSTTKVWFKIEASSLTTGWSTVTFI